MKHAACVLVAVMAASAIAKGPDHMKAATAPAEIPRDEAKATLVIHSNTDFHLFKAVHEYFLGDKLIAQDKTDAYSITMVEPGEHWLFFTVKEKIMNTGKFSLEAGKVYYVLRKAVPGGSIMTTQTPEQFAEYLKSSTPTYLEFSPQDDDFSELDADDIQDEKEEFEEEAKEDPEKHADVLNYKGF